MLQLPPDYTFVIQIAVFLAVWVVMITVALIMLANFRRKGWV